MYPVALYTLSQLNDTPLLVFVKLSFVRAAFLASSVLVIAKIVVPDAFLYGRTSYS